MRETKRQLEVLELIKKGLSNKLIARELNITESTVKLHVSALLKNYGLSNRTQLGVYLIGERSLTLPNLEETPMCWAKITLNKVTAVMFTLPKVIGEWLPLYKKSN